ncbi:hypothetical protein ACA910_020044 [Epithemia clementina (nom. ined.)]
MKDGQEKLSQLFGAPVQYCYNPTSQSHFEDVFGLFGDLTQAGTQKLGRITNEVNSLVLHLREAVAAVGKGGCVVHIAHSQGALITSLASKLLTHDEMRQIEVIALGGAAAIRKTSQFPFRRCINYYSVNDPLLWVAPTAEQSLRSGRVVGNADEEFCFLAPRARDPVEDHALLGPTYLQALKWEAARFRMEHRSLAYKTLHPIYFATITILRVIHEQFQKLLKFVLHHILHAAITIALAAKTSFQQLDSMLRQWIIRPFVIMVMLLFDRIQQVRGREEEYYKMVTKEEIIKAKAVAIQSSKRGTNATKNNKEVRTGTTTKRGQTP